MVIPRPQLGNFQSAILGIFILAVTVVRRVASAVGQGAVTVSFVHRYLETV
jgi:hypothetical protein